MRRSAKWDLAACFIRLPSPVGLPASALLSPDGLAAQFNFGPLLPTAVKRFVNKTLTFQKQIDLKFKVTKSVIECIQFTTGQRQGQSNVTVCPSSFIVCRCTIARHLETGANYMTIDVKRKFDLQKGQTLNNSQNWGPNCCNSSKSKHLLRGTKSTE